MRADRLKLAGFFVLVLMGIRPAAACAAARPQSETRADLISPVWRYFDNNELPPIGPTRTKVEMLIEKAIAEKKATFVAVYFRDLNNGPWFGINERENFIPASLLKVPVLISVMKSAELSPGFLAKKVTASGDDLYAPSYVSTITAQSGREYTIEELLGIMITYSDNSAAYTLVSALDRDLLKDVYEDLGIGNPFEGDNQLYQIRIKDYAGFFRILYNASYLSPEMSQRALEFLTRSQFSNGFLRVLPAGTRIAHKFGERTMPDGSRQLHECGIVYAPGRPYLLCVMTRGSDFEALADVIRKVAAQVDEYVRNAPSSRVRTSGGK